MKPARHAASLAALTVLALGLAACDVLGPDTPEPTEPALGVSVPERFASDSPAWDVASDLPAGGQNVTAISPDGNHYSYAQRDPDTITVGQLNLATGERAETSLDALAVGDDGTGGRVSLFYSGSRLVVTHSGTSSDGDSQWSTALLQVGSSSEPEMLTEAIADGASVKLPSEASGPLVTATKGQDSTTYMVNTETGTFSEYPLGETISFEGCGDPTNCDIALAPAVQDEGTTVATFKEGRPAATTICSQYVGGEGPDKRSGFDYCLAGFMTEKWSSQDPEIAPTGSIAESAYIYASGDGYLVGSWRGEDGSTMYRTLNINDPGASHAVVQCDNPQGGTGSHVLHRSPSGQYLAAGSLLFDTSSGEGRCIDDGVRVVSVSDSGTAWGATDESWMPSRYSSSAVSVTMDGTVSQEGEGVAVPMSFVSSNGAEAGAFAVQEDALAGATVVVVYPFRT